LDGNDENKKKLFIPIKISINAVVLKEIQTKFGKWQDQKI
jgi:hypothetical protein